jgi:alkylhydroperoxidase/carboxymuconolactone decarboxylase family protein YurZ
MSSENAPSEDLPGTASDVATNHPDVWDAYSDLGEACANAGPIDGETRRLVKLALAIGARSEGATHSHTRRALEEGVDPEALEHVARLGIPTLGFPHAMAAKTWIEDETRD